MRLDEWLLKHGYFSDLTEAAAVVMAGRVRDARTRQTLDKPGWRTPKDLTVSIVPLDPFVGRGGEKLQGFLTEANLDMKGRVVLDVGSSTGGFTDCALQSGATHVIAVDVGTHQLHEKLRADPRVKVFEQTDVRNLLPSDLIPAPDLVLVDVSFISLKLILPKLKELCPSALFILLFKPQFEVDRDVPKKRGVAPEAEAQESLKEMLQVLGSLGFNVRMTRPSAVKGTKGNQETFILADANFSQEIFRTYDIRGHAERQLPDELFYRLGVVLGRRIKSKKLSNASVGVGRDARVSSPRLFQAVTAGLHVGGVEVHDLGEVTTPMTYFAHYHFDLDAVLQITASHNPKDDNGMKMMMFKETLFGDEIKSLGRDCLKVASSYDPTSAPTFHPINKHIELRTQYLEFLHRQIQLKKKYKIVVDCGNGMAGSIARDVFAPYASSLSILFENVDCRFPNHEADPTVAQNLQDLKKEVVKSQADIGFAFDGDGDRLGVITQSGRIVWGDEILMLLSELVLKQRPGSTIIGEVKCSEKLFQMIERHGGKPIMYRTGHSLIKKKMKEVGAPIAGEMSGHLFFADRYFGFDDAAYGALRVLEVLDELGVDLDTWINQFPPSFVTPEIRVDCVESEKAGLVEQVKSYFSKIPNAKASTIDGVRVSFPDGAWALVRASNTQAVLVVRVEASGDARLKEVLAEVEKALGRSISYV